MAHQKEETMHLELEYQGKTYKGSSEELSVPLEKYKSELYYRINSVDKIKLELEDGSCIIVGQEVIKRSIIRIIP